MKAKGCKKEIRQVGYYDLLFLDTSITSLIVNKIHPDWKGTILDFLNTSVGSDCKVNLSICSRRLENEVCLGLILWSLEQFEASSGILSLRLTKLKKFIKKNIENGCSSYSEKSQVRHFLVKQYETDKESTEKSLAMISSGYDIHITALNTVKFLIKNNVFTYDDVLAKIKDEIGKYNNI